MTAVATLLALLATGARAQAPSIQWIQGVGNSQSTQAFNSNFIALQNANRDNLVKQVSDVDCSASNAALVGATEKGGFIYGGSCVQVNSSTTAATSLVATSTSGAPGGANGITYGGGVLSYSVVVSSFDVASAGIDVDTLTITASSGTYAIVSDIVIVVNTELRLRFNGDSTTTRYNSSEHYSDTSGNDSNDSGVSIGNCYLGRGTIGAQATYPYTINGTVTLNGNTASVSYNSFYHQMTQASTSINSVGGCEYLGVANVTSMSLIAITASGKFQGHLELRRIR